MKPFLQNKSLRIMIALFLVYISWGSVFVFIKFALPSFPPFALCGTRMTLAGVILYFITWLTGERTRPSRHDLIQSFGLAIFMVTISSGLMTKSQEVIPSGTAAMFTGTTPIWMVLGGWLLFKEERPTLFQSLGLIGGTAGVFALAVHQGEQGTTSYFGLFLMLLSVLGWVCGSFYSKSKAATTNLSVMRNSALLMFMGGLQAYFVSFAMGESFSLAAVTGTSLIAMAGLVLLGAVTGYTTYFWLLMNARTAVAISFEYVNPVIGVFLGWWLAGEQVDYMVITACCAIVGSVFFIISGKHA